jgi:pantoate--beta-alanine ligase
MSSRNKYLTPDERRQAVVLWQAIQRARQRVQAGKVPAAGLEKELLALIGQAPAARVDYIRFFDPATLKPVSEAGRGTHLALAVYIGHTRLIDNARL